MTEAQLMKKYYFTLNSKKKKGKIGDFNHLKHRVTNTYVNSKPHKKDKKSSYTEAVSHSKPLFDDTTSNDRVYTGRSAYRQPRPEDY